MNKLADKALTETLEAYADCNMRMTVAAEKLFVHNHTVMYRLEKIKEQTKLDPRNFHDLAKLLGYIR